jgi:hypothetical protein
LKFDFNFLFFEFGTAIIKIDRTFEKLKLDFFKNTLNVILGVINVDIVSGKVYYKVSKSEKILP